MKQSNKTDHPKGTIDINTERCKGCGLCISVCPKNIISLVDRQVNTHGYPFVSATNIEECIGCASCGIICPDGCITVYRTKKEGGNA